MMMLFLGAIIAAMSISVGSALAVVIPIADFVLIILGILLIMDRNPFKSLPQIQIPALAHPYANAFVYGLLYGPIALPCSGPLVVSIFAISLRSAGFLSRLGTFMWFGLGFGLPLLVLSFKWSASKTDHHFLCQAFTVGEFSQWVIDLGLGVYDLIINWEFIRSSIG